MKDKYAKLGKSFPYAKLGSFGTGTPRDGPSMRILENIEVSRSERAQIIQDARSPIRVCQSYIVLCRKCSKSWRDPLSPLFWSQRYHQVKNWKKILMLEGERTAPKFIYIAYVANIPQMKFVLQKPCLQMNDMTQNHGQTPSAHCFGPKGFTKWKIFKKIWC